MTKPKRHHFLPECYLKGFTEDNMLYVYDRHADQYRRQTPKNTAVESHRYSLESESGEKDPCIETELLAMIDGWFPEVIAKVNQGLVLLAQDKDKLSLFVSHLWLRVPDHEKMCNEVFEGMLWHSLRFKYSGSSDNKARHEQFLCKHPELGHISFEEMQQAITSGDYKLIPPRSFYLMSMVGTAKDAARYFRQMDWIIAHPPPGSIFITTDCPFTLIAPPDHNPNGFWGVGITTLGAVKALPLSKTSFLFMHDQGERVRHCTIDQEHTRRVNLTLAHCCDGHLYGSSKELLTSLVKRTGISKTQKGSRARIS